ncbi:MBL fold metallo-hydrolase [Aurantivibrio infirmus]
MADLHTSIVEKDISPGVPVRLSNLVTRITAPNSGPMTGPGTNTYLIGQQDITVVDPGPKIDSHIQAILEAGAGRIKTIAVTHTHPDHSPAALPIAQATGATLVGAVLEDDGHQDSTFKPDKQLQHGDAIVTQEYSLEGVFTPGHVGNHFCFCLPEEKMMFVGDHIMQGATVVIIPPSGDMLDYIASLQLIKQYDVELIAPAHGHLMNEAYQVVDDLVAHRLRREDKVVESLQLSPNSNLDTLMAFAYADVDKRLYKIAKLSLWAHLLKLEKEFRATKHAEDHWLFGDELWTYKDSASTS